MDYWRFTALSSMAALPLGLASNRAYQALPCLDRASHAGPLPSLSIIIPARNEEENMACLLPSLRAICYPGPVEVIVVDDQSDDRTAEVAAAFGAQVAAVADLPAGWLGKPHACHVGARAATGEWLLFTDADTAHAPDGPARAVGHALRHGLDGLSLFPRQQTRGITDRLPLMAAFAALFAGLWDTSSVLNGQYILLRRAVYEAVGDFAAVRDQPIEDMALGARLREAGYHAPILRGEDVVAVRMYRDAAQMWQGMTRLGGDSLSFAGAGWIGQVAVVTALMSPLITAYGALTGRIGWGWALSAWGAAALGILPWAQRFGSAWAALGAPLGAIVVQAAGVWGLAARLTGRKIRWRGRRV